MFSNSRKKLAIYFAGLMIVFLIAVNLINYYMLSTIIYRDREKELTRLIDVEAYESAKKLISRNVLTERPVEYHDDDHDEDYDDEYDDDKFNRAGVASQPFYYILNENGNLVFGDSSRTQLNNSIISFLKGWAPDQKEVQHRKFESGDDRYHFIFAGQSVYKDHKLIGRVYVGIDVSQQTNVLHQFVIILASLSGFILIGSIAVGYLMAGRAMKPIIGAFKKQQQFTADASHELRTPLSVLMTSLEVLESEEKDKMSTFSSQVLEDSKDEVRRMTKLVGNLLTLARADSAEGQMHFTQFSLREELERIYRKFQPVVAKTGHKFNLEVDGEFEITADRERLVQLVLILLDNAVQYSESPGTIAIQAISDGKWVRISVSDTGKGIPAEKQQEIFERFVRVDLSRNRTSHNTGLGLSIAKWIVEAHQGSIKVDSVLGEGSTFTVMLPRRQ